MKTTTRRRGAALVLVSAFALASCGGSDSTGSDTTLATSEASVTVTNQWARTSPMAASTGAAYMDIVATDGDELLSASVDASVAAKAEVHEVVMSEDGDHSMTDDSMADDSMSSDDSSMGSDTTMPMSGEMTMREVDKIVLPAGETVSLKPGGYHIMLLDLVAPLEAGSTISVTLTFATAGEITIDVPVQEEAP